MTKKSEWKVAALVGFLGAAGIAVCGAQAPPVTGVCVANCGGGGGGNTNTTHAEARAYSSYVKAYNQALKQYQQAIRLGATAQGLSLCQSAQRSVDEALQYAPGDGDAQRLRHGIMGCIDACNGVFAVRNGEYDRGIAFYRQAESDDPADRNLWEQGIAWAESARNQAIADANARAAADRARDKNAQLHALFERGNQLQESGDYKAAEEIWRQAIALDPQNSSSYYNLGNSLLRQSRYTEAEAAYRKATELDPTNSYAQYELGYVLEEQERYAEAEPALRQAAQLDPKDSSALHLLGYVLLEQQRYAEAETALRRVLQLNPNDWNAETDLGRTLWGLGRPVEAEAAYQKAAQLNPKESFPHYELGIMLERQKRYADAEAAYRRALELSPGDADYQHALQYVMDLETKARQQQASQPATPLITAGENLRDAPNSGGVSEDKNASSSSQSQKALDEANSTRGATGQGLQSTTPEGKTTGRREDAVASGSKIFDTTGPKIEAPPVDLRGMGKAPTDVKLLSHIPKNAVTANDKEIKASVDWYSKLESDKVETQQKIANIQKQIESKQGDPGILKMEQTQYTNDLQNIQQNQQRAEDAIKKRLKNLSMQWIDDPAPPKTETKPDTATQEKNL